MQKIQVDKSHYKFDHYISKHRWASMWHQLDEVIKRDPKSVLEIGPGPGVFKSLATAFDVHVETLDIDPELKPDHVTSANKMPFADRSYDVVCAFQMLEHVPYELSLEIFKEMSRVSRKCVIISLPDARTLWPYKVYVPKIGEISFCIPRPQLQEKVHKFDGEHYWEVNTRGYALQKVCDDFKSVTSLSLESMYRVPENPYHRFFIWS